MYMLMCFQSCFDCLDFILQNNMKTQACSINSQTEGPWTCTVPTMNFFLSSQPERLYLKVSANDAYYITSFLLVVCYFSS